MERPRLIVWAEPEQADIVADAVRAMHGSLVAVGGPTPDATAALGDALAVATEVDLRRLARHENVDVLWLAAAADVDGDVRQLIRARGVVAVTSAPIPATPAALRACPDDAATAAVVPAFRAGAGFRAGLDALEAIGERTSIVIAFDARPEEGPLRGRLYDAMDTLLALGGSAAAIAAAAAPRGGVPETLEHLHGHLAVSVRRTDGGCAALAVSDTAAAWHRRVRVSGPGGTLTITDDDYVFADHSAHEERGGIDRKRPATAGTLVGEHVLRLRDRLDVGTLPPADTERILLHCEAARLSARTGQVEAPDRVEEMLRRV